MAEASGTRASLIVRIRDPNDREAWRQFVAIYAPLIHGFARSRGLQDADAADLTQEVLRAMAAPGLPYDPERGSFRGWLFTVTRNKVHDFLTGPAHRERGGGDSATQQLLDSQPAPEESDRWERDYRQHVFQLAAEQVREAVAPATWQAFWLVAVEGKSGDEAARQLSMTAGAVYVARSRVLARLRSVVDALQQD